MKKEYEVIAGEINLRVGRELKNYKVGDLIIVDDQFAKNALVNQVKPTGRILEEGCLAALRKRTEGGQEAGSGIKTLKTLISYHIWKAPSRFRRRCFSLLLKTFQRVLPALSAVGSY